MVSLNNQIFAIDNMDTLREVINACNIRYRELELRAAAMVTIGDKVSFKNRRGEKIGRAHV